MDDIGSKLSFSISLPALVRPLSDLLTYLYTYLPYMGNKHTKHAAPTSTFVVPTLAVPCLSITVLL